MYLKSIQELKLLPNDVYPSELDVLRDVPWSVGLDLGRTTINHLRSNQRNEDMMLLTKSHVEWVMQIIGHTFKLPINDKTQNTIGGGIKLYEKWMHHELAPAPIQQYPQFFAKRMCCHLSLIFKDRNISRESQDFQLHITLCQRVLAIYSESARCPPNGVIASKWNEFLCRIFLGICNEIMKVCKY